jgi:nicotinamide riboside kinase
MEKIVYPDNSLKRILITGPESTGKSELAVALARHFGGTCIPEYARAYIEVLGRPYEYRDVEIIAKRQAMDYENSGLEQNWTFFDTWLIITKIWFEVVYGQVPIWVDEIIGQASFDLVLLCDTDIPWVADPVRENGGQRREELLEMYKNELDRNGLKWVLVRGTGEERLKQALKLINKNFQYGTI